MRHSITKPRRHAWLALTGGLVGTLLLAACGDSDSGPGVASLGDESDGSEEAIAGDDGEPATEEEILDWTSCMRDNGVDVGDPEVDEDGNLQPGNVVVQRGGDAQLGDMGEAMDECGEPPGGFGGGNRLDPSEMQDAALELAQCMRDNGVDMPDPDFSGGGVIFGGDPDNPAFDPDDPAFQNAMEECRHITEDIGGRGSDGGPGAQVGGGEG